MWQELSLRTPDPLSAFRAGSGNETTAKKWSGNETTKLQQLVWQRSHAHWMHTQVQARIRPRRTEASAPQVLSLLTAVRLFLRGRMWGCTYVNESSLQTMCGSLVSWPMYRHHMTPCPPVAIVKRCYGIHLLTYKYFPIIISGACCIVVCILDLWTAL